MKSIPLLKLVIIVSVAMLTGCASAIPSPTTTPNPSSTPTATPMPSPSPVPVILQYLGNSCILIKAPDGTRIVSDPYSKNAHSKGLKALPDDLVADAVTISHIHNDHNYAEGVKGNPQVFTEPGLYQVGMVKITAYEGREGSPSGSSNMRDTIFVFEIDGVKIVHLGDSGIITDAEVLAGIDNADIVIVNIDGYVILADQIMPFMKQIHARSILPSHYSHLTNARWNGAPTINEFLETLPSDVVVVRDGSEIQLIPNMPDQVLVLAPLMLK
jgi:L-ascorbate metabolism protein UlaG (beta-lactamase superfamily)